MLNGFQNNIHGILGREIIKYTVGVYICMILANPSHVICNMYD
jgi:hypothetical protein